MLLKMDSHEIFHFASLQSDFGQGQIEALAPDLEGLDSVVLVETDQVRVKSDAVLRILILLGGWYWIFYPLKAIPRVIRDGIYDWVARNRSGWFGQRDTCMVPTPELERRFLD